MEFYMGQDIEQEEHPANGSHKKDTTEMIAASDPNLIVMGGPNNSLQDYWNTISKSMIWKSMVRKRKIKKIYGKKEE
jgi:hypothetical protein